MDGSAWSFSRWLSGRPDNYGGNQHCLGVWTKYNSPSTFDKYYDDFFCTDLGPFVCGPNGQLRFAATSKHGGAA